MAFTFLIFITVAIIIIILLLFKYSTKNYSYWKKRNVPYIKPLPLVGNLLDTLTLKKTISETLAIYYKKFKSPYFGMYLFDQPLLVVRDPELIKHVLVKDFNFFSDRYAISNEETDPLASHMLFFAKNPEWKYMRTKMSPVFSSGKLKNMVYLITEAGKNLNTYLNIHCSGNAVEAKEICGKYSTDVIASCAFGLHAHSFDQENAPFRKAAREMFDFTLKGGFQQTSYFIAHKLVKIFRVPFFDLKVANFLRNAFWKTLEERENSQVIRHDVIDIIKGFKNTAPLSDGFKFEGDKILAQAAQFFAAGFETVSTTMSFALYELCLHPDLQERLRSEIHEMILDDGTIDYDSIQNMTYLHSVICETLRKYPILSFMDRKCIEDYKFPNVDLIIQKGTPVYITVLGLHYDEEYFPDPHKFDPERFSKANKRNLRPFTYLPFGDGPRNCIGERFGLLVTKIGLVEILKDFAVEPSSDTPNLIKFSSRSVFLTSEIGFPLRFKKIS